MICMLSAIMTISIEITEAKMNEFKQRALARQRNH